MHSETIERLIVFASGGELRDETVRARAEYFAEVKDVYAEEPFYESRLQAFLEWYCIDRPVGGTGRTPLLMLMEQAVDFTGEDMAFFTRLASSRHSLFVFLGESGGLVRVRDAFTGDGFEVREDRPLLTVKKGDLLETRLIPAPEGDVFHFSRTFLTHPREVRHAVLHEIASAKRERRLNAEAFMHQLAILWVRAQRYKGVSALDLYNPFELRKPNQPVL
jgi:hypothetical protein